MNQNLAFAPGFSSLLRFFVDGLSHENEQGCVENALDAELVRPKTQNYRQLKQIAVVRTKAEEGQGLFCSGESVVCYVHFAYK